jgi:beta-lactamase class A
LNEGIPAALPPGNRVAHKTGSITRHYHDAALVYPKGRRKPYVLVVMTKDFEREEDAVEVVRNISRTVWTHVVDAGRQTH